MKINKTILKNGLCFLTTPLKGTETVTVMVLVATGSKYENRETAGLSHFLEHMMFKGTTKRPTTSQIAEELDRVGGVYNAFTGDEYTGYWVKVDAGHLDLALDVLADMLLNSRFLSTEIEREKGVILEEIKMYQDSPLDYVSVLYEQLLYGDQPAGSPVIGRAETVKSFKRENLLRYFREQYRGQSVVISLAGRLPEKGLEEKISNFFSSFPTGKARGKASVKEEQTAPKFLVHEKQTDQTHLILGVRAYNLFHPDRYGLSLLASILGGMMSSRLWLKVRERLGLAYYLRTVIEMTTDTGALSTQAGVDHSKIGETVKAILEEYRLISEKLVSRKELDKAKDNICGKLLLGTEASEAVASSAAIQELLTGRALTPKQVIRKIKAVTAADIRRISRDIFCSEKLNLCLISPTNPSKVIDKLLKL